MSEKLPLVAATATCALQPSQWLDSWQFARTQTTAWPVWGAAASSSRVLQLLRRRKSESHAWCASCVRWYVCWRWCGHQCGWRCGTSWHRLSLSPLWRRRVAPVCPQVPSEPVMTWRAGHGWRRTRNTGGHTRSVRQQVVEPCTEAAATRGWTHPLSVHTAIMLAIRGVEFDAKPLARAELVARSYGENARGVSRVATQWQTNTARTSTVPTYRTTPKWRPTFTRSPSCSRCTKPTP